MTDFVKNSQEDMYHNVAHGCAKDEDGLDEGMATYKNMMNTWINTNCKLCPPQNWPPEILDYIFHASSSNHTSTWTESFEIKERYMNRSIHQNYSLSDHSPVMSTIRIQKFYSQTGEANDD